MTKVIEVRTGARLHFGLIATSPSGGPFGGIGLMIDQPGFVIQAWRAKRDRVLAATELTPRIEEFVGRVRTDLNQPWCGQSVEDPAARVAIRVVQEIPAHRGFGSGTQLAYAVATAMANVLDAWPEFRPDHELGRGTRSAVGTLGFSDGGFIADFGLFNAENVARFAGGAVPSQWRFVIVDPQGPTGPAGAAETAGFESLPPMPRSTTERLVEALRSRILPGLDQTNFRLFAGGIAEFNRLVGEHFAPAQGGTYAHPLIRSLATRLRETDWPYIAQSSWGPAAAILCDSDASAAHLLQFLDGSMPSAAATVFVASPRNRGASVRRLLRKPKRRESKRS